jgi:hypothetical protein
MSVNEQDREDDRAYRLIMRTLDTSLGYRLMWALDRLGWRIARQKLDDHKFPAPYQSSAKWPHWMEPADRDELKRVIEDDKQDDAQSDKSGDEEAP